MEQDLLSIYNVYTQPLKGCQRFHTWAALSMMSATLERRVWLTLGGLGRLHPNQFIILCGPPGTGKTVSSKLATSFLTRYNKLLSGNSRKINFGPDKVTPAALLLHMRDRGKTIRFSEGDFDQSAIYMHSTEFATMIKDIGGGSLSDDLLKLYDCDSRFEKQLVGMGTIAVNGPCLNLIADTTPAFLAGFLPREESGTGLTARIIFATQFGEVEMDAKVPDGNKELEKLILRHIARMHQMVGPFRLTPEAEGFWADWYPKHRKSMFQLGDDTFMRHFYNRKPDHIRKVSMTISAGRDSSRLIELDDITRSIEIIEEAEPFMDKSFGVKDFRKIIDTARPIVSAIPFEPGEIGHARLIYTLFFEGGLAGEATHFDGLLAHLVAGGIIKRRVDGSGQSFYSRPKEGT